MEQSVAVEGIAGLPVGILPVEWLAEQWPDWETRLFPALQEVVRRIIREVLESIDDQLAQVRDSRWQIEARRRHILVTPWGAVTIRRRLYRRGKDRLFLLDRLMGWKPGRSYTAKVAQLAALVASQLPFRPASEVLEALGIPLSHMTVHRLVQQVGGRIAEQQEGEAEELFSQGTLPPSEDRVVDRLYIEADGVWIALQREQQRRQEIWSSISYEGWQAIVPKHPRTGHPPIRYRLAGKQVFSDLAGRGALFWQRHITALHHRYDLRQVKDWVLSGDGAKWIDMGQGYFPNCRRQLDRFHLARALHRGLGDLAAEAYQLCISGQWAKTARLWERALQAATSDDRRRLIGEQQAYLRGQVEALEDYRLRLPDATGCRSLGAMESNGDKLIKNRMAKRGMAWTKRGAKHMAKVLQERKNGQLERWVDHPPVHAVRATVLIPRPPSAAAVLQELQTDDAHWLAASLPILVGPGPQGPLLRALREACHA